MFNIKWQIYQQTKTTIKAGFKELTQYLDLSLPSPLVKTKSYKIFWPKPKHINKKLCAFLNYLLFGNYCHLCDKAHLLGFALCKSCLKVCKYLSCFCYQCGHPLYVENPHTKIKCGKCLTHKRPIYRTVPALTYEDESRSVIHKLKYQKRLDLALPLATLLAHQVKNQYNPQSLPLGLIAVPMHPRKIRKRGYNQSLLITKQLARKLTIQNYSDQIKKVRHTADQATLTPEQRKSNLSKAFVISKPLPNHIAIIDDVMTTGETVFEIARTLKKHGVKRVDVWCVARACQI